MIKKRNKCVRSRTRSGFTLMELLLVVSIIAILATLALGVMQGAQNDARVAATQSRLQLIESMLLQEMEDYEVRRLPFSNSDLQKFVEVNRITGSPQVPINVQLKNLRRRITAEIIRSEMPGWNFDGANYLTNDDIGRFPSGGTVPLGAPAPFDISFGDWLDAAYSNPEPVTGVTLRQFLASRPTSRIQYWRQFNNIDNGNARNANFNLPGEYLYRILENIDVDGTSGVELLGASAIDDTDADEIPEIVDEWGKSMQLRVLQVRIGSFDIARDVYQDVTDVNWAVENPSTLLPTGYEVINPIIPRSVQQFRFQVVSPELDSYTK